MAKPATQPLVQNSDPGYPLNKQILIILELATLCLQVHFFCLFDPLFELEYCHEKSDSQLGCWNTEFQSQFDLFQL